MGHKHILLASFVNPNELDQALERISKVANINKRNIFVFKAESIDDYILTYNIQQETGGIRFNKIWPDTISIHRKKETNTLFSLNAMNELIKLENDGKLITSYQVNWQDYQNCFLLFRNGFLTVLELELIKINR